MPRRKVGARLLFSSDDNPDTGLETNCSQQDSCFIGSLGEVLVPRCKATLTQSNPNLKLGRAFSSAVMRPAVWARRCPCASLAALSASSLAAAAASSRSRVAAACPLPSEAHILSRQCKAVSDRDCI